MQKLLTLTWFARRPSFYPHLAALMARSVTGAARHEGYYAEAFSWAEGLAVPRREALVAVGWPAAAPTLPMSLVDEGKRRAEASDVEMGGPGDLDLLYGAIIAGGARRVIETGVAYGWSSLAALAALRETGGRLVSVDMPYPKAGNEAFVGIVVPEEWRESWTLIRRPDRNGLRQAIADFGGEIDLCHYDSDKSYPGRMFAFPLLWRALRPGGLFISDDISDNFGFRDFFSRIGVDIAVVRSQGKHVGIARKPS
jgi:predicted O-methyltransferase YrrM